MYTIIYYATVHAAKRVSIYPRNNRVTDSMQTYISSLYLFTLGSKSLYYHNQLDIISNIAMSCFSNGIIVVTFKLITNKPFDQFRSFT